VSIVELFFFSLALGTDTFPLAIGISTPAFSLKLRILIIFTVGFLYTVTPPIGMWLGEKLWMIEGYHAKVFGAVVLIMCGTATIYSSMCNKIKKDFFNPKTLFLYISVLSIESTCVGFSMGTIHLETLIVGVVLGIGGTLMMVGGMCLGNILVRFLKKPEIISGIILIFLGLDVLFKKKQNGFN